MNMSNDQIMQKREGSNSAKIKHEPMNRFHKHDFTCHDNDNKVKSKSRHSRQGKIHGTSSIELTPTKNSAKASREGGGSPFRFKKHNFKNRKTMMSA